MFIRYWRSIQRSRSNYGGSSVQVIVYGQHLCGQSTVDRVIHAWWGRCRAAHMCGVACFKYVRWRSKTFGGWSGLVSVTSGLTMAGLWSSMSAPTKCLRSFSSRFCVEWMVESTVVVALGPG